MVHSWEEIDNILLTNPNHILSTRPRLMYTLSCGRLGYHPHSNKEIAKIFNLSESRVSALTKQATLAITEHLNNK